MDLVGAIAMVKRRWLVIALCLLAGIAGGFDLGHRGAKQYRSTAQCLLNIPATPNVNEGVAATQYTLNLVQTYASLVSSEAVAGRANSILHSQGVNATVSGLSASVENNTFLIDVTADSTTPQLAAATANAGASALKSLVAHFQAGIPQPISVTITSPAGVPLSPYSPRPTLDLLVGVILGLLAGFGIATVLESLDRTIKSTHDSDAALGVPLVGLVPKRRGARLVVDQTRQGSESEPYRSLRTAIRFLEPDRPLRVLLVTSPTQGDGKTATAANLAAALALSGDRVVAVDADLRHAGLSEAFGIDRSVGLTSLVLGSAELDEVLQQRTPNLAVLATGPLPPNPSEILGSQLVHRVLSEIAARADVVVIDAPPVLPVADALVLAPQVDGVVLVVRHGKTLRHAAAEAARRLEAIGAPFIGYVLNGVPRGESRGIYADDRYTAANERPPVVRDSGRRAARGVNGLRTSTPPSVDVPARSPARTGVVSRHGRETVVPDPATRRSARRRDQERE